MKLRTAVILALTLLAGLVVNVFGQQSPSPQQVSAIVQQVAGDRADLLRTNTYESCFEFLTEVLKRTNSPDWGYVGKTGGEGQHNLEGKFGFPRQVGAHKLTGVSHDVIFHRPTGQQFDLLGNSAARSDERPEIWGNAVPMFDPIPTEKNRPNNPFVSFPLGKSDAPPAKFPPYPSNEGTLDAAGSALFADFAEAGQGPNAQMFRFAFRIAYDWLAGNEPTLDASVKKHRREWRSILGLPPLP